MTPPHGIYEQAPPTTSGMAGHMAALGLSGSAGILAAAFMDFQQKGAQSALFIINQWAAEAAVLLGAVTPPPLWAVMLGLIVVGAGFVFYFKPSTAQAAFAQGFGALAVVATTVPADVKGGVGGTVISERPAQAQPVTAPEVGTIVGVSFEPADRLSPDQVYVTWTVVYPNGFPAPIEQMQKKGTLRATFYNATTKRYFNDYLRKHGSLRVLRDTPAAPAATTVVEGAGPVETETVELWLRVECAGYEIYQQSRTATRGEHLQWDVEMRPTWMPLWLQRLGTSFWF